MTTPMPTPNIPDEVVEAAAKAVERAANPQWSDDQFDTWWNKDELFCERRTSWVGYENMTRKEKLLSETRTALEAALPLLLEQKGWLDAFGTAWNSEGHAKAIGDVAEPLYRLKVSNER